MLHEHVTLPPSWPLQRLFRFVCSVLNDAQERHYAAVCFLAAPEMT
jgi:hypothetical protein